MIGPSGTVRVMVATKPVDFRKGMEGLAMLVREHMKADPFSGAVYVFRAKRADRIKLIFWDGTGLCLFAKRLEDGVFRWPKIEDGVMRLSAVELSALLEGSIREPMLDPLAKDLQGGRHTGDLVLALRIVAKKRLLASQRLHPLLQVAAAPFILVKRQDRPQISITEPLDLLREMRLGPAQRLATGEQFLR